MGPQRYVTLRFVTLRCNAANSAQGNAMRLDESSTHTHTWEGKHMPSTAQWARFSGIYKMFSIN